jgi:uncharacterized membrane protein
VVEQPSTFPPLRWLSTRAAWALTLAAFALVAGTWLALTPPGLLGKADAIGYAICHRIDLRSFHLGDRPLPLCARCTGIYLGALFGVLTMMALGRARVGGLPRTPVLVVLVGFIGLMGVDGLNSYATLFPGLPHLYEPSNWLRLTTGTLNGLAVAGLIYPVFNQTVWRRVDERPILNGARDLGRLLLVAAALIALVLTEADVVLYPLAVLSALGVVLLLTMLYMIGIVVLTGRQNALDGWRDAALPALAALTLALLQIGVIDAVRYAVFGTWAGFAFPG